MANTLQQLILKFPDKPWYWYGLSYNPNITMNFVLENPDKLWNWEWLSMNGFLLNSRLIKIKQKRKQKIIRKFNNKLYLIKNTNRNIEKFLIEHTFKEYVTA